MLQNQATGLWNVRGGVHSVRCQHQDPAAWCPVAGRPHLWEGDRAAQMVAQREAVPGALFLGDGKRLLHLNLATVCDRHILQGLVPAVCFRALHLPYYLLGREAAGYSKVRQEGHPSREKGPGIWLGRLRTPCDQQHATVRQAKPSGNPSQGEPSSEGRMQKF